MASQIALEGIVYYATHGAYPEENTLGAKYELDIYLEVSTDTVLKAAETDDLSQTVNYKKIFEIASEIMLERQKLLETLACKIAHAILIQEPKVLHVQVRVSKYHPPLGGVCNRTFVSLELNQNQI
jgi:dihydroneopterin aldolase